MRHTQSDAQKKMFRMLFSALLFFVLCFLYCLVCPVAAKHSCIFDRIARKTGPMSGVKVRELPRKGRSGVHILTASDPGWAPIRFGIFTEDMRDPKRYCSDVWQIRPTFAGSNAFCKRQDVLTDEKRNTIINEILPQAAQLHADRLFVKPVDGNIVVPFYLGYVCSFFTKPRSHHTDGVSDVDIVLYASAGVSEKGVLGWASVCAAFADNRPAVGVINMSPYSAASVMHSVRIVAHEIAHVLGFNIFAMREKRMVVFKDSVRGKPSVLLVRSNRTLEKTQAHYNCTSVFGMELEDEGGDGTEKSHWEMRNAKDELMAGGSGIGYYTSLTMAVFEDLGFYRANWSMAETMGWGLNAGCKFLEEKCVINGKTNYPDMFCTTDTAIRNGFTCTSDRLALGSCIFYKHKFLPPWYQYFTDPCWGSLRGFFTDLCPVVTRYSSTGCADGKVQKMPGSRVGPASRCLKGDTLMYNSEAIGDVCAEVRCDSGSVSVRYAGNDTWHKCFEGGSILPKGNFTAGRIMCPRYHEVCFEKASDREDAKRKAHAVKEPPAAAAAGAEKPIAGAENAAVLPEKGNFSTSVEDMDKKAVEDTTERDISSGNNATEEGMVNSGGTDEKHAAAPMYHAEMNATQPAAPNIADSAYGEGMGFGGKNVSNISTYSGEAVGGVNTGNAEKHAAAPMDHAEMNATQPAAPNITDSAYGEGMGLGKKDLGHSSLKKCFEEFEGQGCR